MTIIIMMMTKIMTITMAVILDLEERTSARIVTSRMAHAHAVAQMLLAKIKVRQFGGV